MYFNTTCKQQNVACVVVHNKAYYTKRKTAEAFHLDETWGNGDIIILYYRPLNFKNSRALNGRDVWIHSEVDVLNYFNKRCITHRSAASQRGGFRGNLTANGLFCFFSTLSRNNKNITHDASESIIFFLFRMLHI